MNTRRDVKALKAYPLTPVLRRDYLRLDLNESNWGCAPSVLEAIGSLNPEMVGFYPDYADLQVEINRHLGLTPAQFILSNGADDGIRAVMQTFVESGDKVVLATPSFGMIALHARVMGARILEVPYQADLKFPAEGFLKLAEEQPKLIAVVRPDSPCGDAISRSQLIALLEKAPNSLIMLDETYHHFLEESCLDLLGRYSNLLILQSFSKAVGLAGLRLGMVAAQPELVNEMRKVNPPFAVNAVAVAAGKAALQAGTYVQEVVAKMKREKVWLLKELANLGISPRNSRANFVLANLGDRSASIHQKLLEAGILVKHLSGIPILAGHFRIAVAPREGGERLVEALKAILNGKGQ